MNESSWRAVGPKRGAGAADVVRHAVEWERTKVALKQWSKWDDIDTAHGKAVTGRDWKGGENQQDTITQKRGKQPEGCSGESGHRQSSDA